LRDRMYKIPVKGFKTDDKIKIAKDYLLNDICKNFNFHSSSIYFSDDIIRHIINYYTKDTSGMIEEGVRTLERCLETIISKLNVLRLYQKKITGNSFVNYPTNGMSNNSVYSSPISMNTESVSIDVDDEDLRLEMGKIKPLNVIYDYQIPFDIPELSFPLVITTQIAAKLLTAPPTMNHAVQMMYT